MGTQDGIAHRIESWTCRRSPALRLWPVGRLCRPRCSCTRMPAVGLLGLSEAIVAKHGPRHGQAAAPGRAQRDSGRSSPWRTAIPALISARPGVYSSDAQLLRTPAAKLASAGSHGRRHGYMVLAPRCRPGLLGSIQRRCGRRRLPLGAPARPDYFGEGHAFRVLPVEGRGVLACARLLPGGRIASTSRGSARASGGCCLRRHPVELPAEDERAETAGRGRSPSRLRRDRLTPSCQLAMVGWPGKPATPTLSGSR